MSCSELQKLGKTILNYFLEQTQENEPFKLCIDTFTFEHCLEISGCNREIIENRLENISNLNISCEYCALVVAAFQVKIAYDIETEQEFIDSYYARISKHTNLESQQQILSYLRCDQEELWKKIKNLFKTQNRTLNIPEVTTGSGRYVQYPKSQRITSSRAILKYADAFIEIGLFPNQCITFNDFCNRVAIKEYLSKEIIIKRMIFNFYNLWDGSPYEKLEHNGFKNNFKKRATDEPEISIKINDKTIQVFLFNEETCMKQESEIIPEQYLTKSFSPHVNFPVFFAYNEDYNDWSVPENLTENEFKKTDYFLLCFDSKIYFCWNNKDIARYNNNGYSIVKIPATPENLSRLQLKTTQQTPIKLIGGIKSRIAWYYFALPTVVVDSKYTTIYLDSEKHDLVQENDKGVLSLPKKLSTEKKHCLKLSDTGYFWFSIIKADNAEIPQVYGWEVNRKKKILIPAKTTAQKKVAGQYFFTLEDLQNCDKLNFRHFQQQCRQLEDRFNHLSVPMENRSKYGI